MVGVGQIECEEGKWRYEFMGFRDLHCFNIAMLGKMGWKLCFASDTLVYKIFKAKYFPIGDFLKAALGSNPSFTWQSVFHSLTLLK